MKGLVAYFVKYPILANILIALTVIGGVVSFLNTKMSFFPTAKDRVINISVAYPGASPEEMEEGVTTKIEESLKSTAGIDEITSTSAENSASISILTLDNYDIDEIYTEVKNAVDGISSFPAGAEKPIIFKQRQRSTAQWLGLTGDVSLKTLKQYAEGIEDDLLASGVISQVNVSGFPPLEISIEVPEETLRRYNLTFDQVVNAVRLNNRDISAGSIKSSSEEILIRSKAKQTEADEISEIVVRSNTDGTNLLLRDIATIKEQFADQPNKALLNGKQAIFLEVRKLETEDLTQISNTVGAYVTKFNEENDAVKLTTTWDFNNMLNQRLDLLTSNGIVGLLLVLLSLGLFLSLRLSFWVAWGIPSSFLGMFILGSMVGLTINMISLFGMILVIGILVDDGIVIAENIYSHFEKSKNPIQAAVRGTLEVVPAVFTSVLTTIVAFLPLLLLTGGFEFLKDMAYVVIFSLAFSFFENYIDLYIGERPGSFVYRELDYNLFNIWIENDSSSFERKIPYQYSDELLSILLRDTINSITKVSNKPLTGYRTTVYNQSTIAALALMMQRSDNFLAEQLLITAGKFKGYNNQDAFRSRLLNTWGLSGEVSWVDGSGLSRYNLFTPRALVKVLERIYDQLDWQEIQTMFPNGGQSGTIKYWYPGVTEPYVFAKTGTLSNNHCLSGYLVTNSGKQLIFSFMNNNYLTPVSEVKVEMQKVLELIRDNY
jgi:preprotein translocase subunit SecF